MSALRGRSLPVADVATRTRLSKSPEAYLATRAGHREAAYEALLSAGKTSWSPGERVRYYRARSGAHVLLPDGGEDGRGGEEAKRDYDVEHYLRVLVASYASRLRKAFEPEDFEQIFRLEEQYGLFDRPIGAIEPRWIRCPARQREAEEQPPPSR